jgi:hypothetical protein
VLAGLILPALQNAQDEAKVASCINNLRQVMLGMEVYRTDFNGHFPLYLAQIYDNGQVPVKEVFLCPMDWNKGVEGARPATFGTGSEQLENADRDGTGYKAKTALVNGMLHETDAVDELLSSYLFEFSLYPTDWDNSTSWLDFKNGQLKDGVLVHENDCCGAGNNSPAGSEVKIGWIPVVRCFWHLENIDTQKPTSSAEPVIDITNFFNIRPRDNARWEHHYE